MVVTQSRSRRMLNERRCASERGGADVFMMMVLVTLIAFAGLAYDMGMAFNAHREATNIAGAAARAGANQVSINALYQDGTAIIDEGLARQAITNRIPAGATEVAVDVTASEVFVEVSTQHNPKILSAFGFGNFTIHGEARALATNGRP